MRGNIKSYCFAVAFLATQVEADNLIKNSSFEVGLEGYGMLRGVYLDQKKEITNWPLVLDAKEKYHGLYSLRIDNPGCDAVKVMVKEVKLKPDKTYTFSAWMKASAPSMTIAAGLFGVEKGAPHHSDGKLFTLTTDWQRYSFVFKPAPGIEYYHPSFYMNAGYLGDCNVPGSVWIDALQLEEGEATAYRPADFEIGVENGLPRYYAISPTEKFPVKFKLRNNSPHSADVKVAYKIVDEYFGKTLKTGEESAVLEPSATTEKLMADISPQKRGKFILYANLMDAKTGALLDSSAFDFAIIESIKKKDFTEGFTVCGHYDVRATWFGLDWRDREIYAIVDGIKDQLDFMAEAGDRWMRSGESLDWRVIEPTENNFNWNLADQYVEETQKRGIRLMPILGDSFSVHTDELTRRNAGPFPDWVNAKSERINPPAQEQGVLAVFLPPLEDWRKYIRACVQRYKGRIDSWEIINEPNGVMSAEHYLPYLRSAWQVIKETDPKAKVIGFSVTGDMGGSILKFLEDCFKSGGLDYCDAVSFHPYSARLDWSAVGAEKMISEIKKLMKAYGGEKKELWNTELFYTGKATQDDNYFQHLVKGHERARRFLIDLANGVSRSFCVPDNYYTKVTLMPNYWTNPGVNVGALIPSVDFVIYNTLAKYFESATFLKQIPLVGRNKLYVFEKGGVPIGAAWNFDDENKPGLIKFPGAADKLKFIDIMGNAMDNQGFWKKDADIVMELTNTPFYIMPDKTGKDEFLKIMEAASARGKTSVELSAQASYTGEKPALALEVKNTTSEALSVLVNAKVAGHEFQIESPANEGRIPAASANTFYFPVETGSPTGGKSRVVFQAMAGDRIVETEAELKFKPLAKCKPAKNKITLDGNIRENEWADAAKIEINRKEQVKGGKVGDWKGPTDCSGTIRLQYDADALYLAARVFDDARGERRSREWAWDGDALELFVDTDPDKNFDVTAYTPNTCQLIFGMPTEKFPGIFCIKKSSSGQSVNPVNITSATAMRNDGYDLVVKIPWKEFDGFSPKSGALLGFDAVLDDGDTLGRKVQLIWAGEENDFQNRSHFGRLLLQ